MIVNYYDYIQSELWKNKSREFIRNAGCCKKCGSKDDLECHHLNYDCLGKETEKDIIVLCKECHKFVHEYNIDYRIKREITVFQKDARWRLVEKQLMILRRDNHGCD